MLCLRPTQLKDSSKSRNSLLYTKIEEKKTYYIFALDVKRYSNN